MTRPEYSNTNPLAVLGLFVLLIVLAIVVAKLDYDLKKRIVREAIREAQQAEHERPNHDPR